MSAHDSTPDPLTLKTRSLHADQSGVSMSWKAVFAVLTLFVGSGAAWTILGLAKLDDLNAHDKRPTAHRVAHDAIYDQMRAQMSPLEAKVDAVAVSVERIQKSVNQDLADRLADRAADGIRNSTRADEVRKLVRDKALYNLLNGLPIRDGIEDKLLK